MKKLILNFLKYIVLVTITLVVCYFLCGPQYSQDYVGSFEDKTRNLESVQEPKIILAGNSNLPFGMDSRQIAESLGMPVVNLGFHGGMGNLFQYNMARLNVQPGDIVVVSVTELDSGLIQDASLAWITLENRWDLWWMIPKENYWDMLIAAPNYVVDTITALVSNRNATLKQPYSRAAFNEYGDIAYPRETSILDLSTVSVKIPTITEEGVSQLNALNQFCVERGAVCLLTACPILKIDQTPSPEEYAQYQAELEARLDCRIVSDFADYMYDASYFYDTKYHLTDAGVQLRTQQLISDLNDWMAEKE